MRKLSTERLGSFAQGHTQLVNGEWSLYLNRLAWESIVSARAAWKEGKEKQEEGRKSNEWKADKSSISRSRAISRGPSRSQDPYCSVGQRLPAAAHAECLHSWSMWVSTLLRQMLATLLHPHLTRELELDSESQSFSCVLTSLTESPVTCEIPRERKKSSFQVRPCWSNWTGQQV